jgi:O-succinylbenzoic acid--CoA ligase
MAEHVDWPTRDLLSHRVAATPDRTALVDVTSGDTWTYRAFDERVDRLVPVLDSHTTPHESRIAFLLDTRIDFADLVFAAMRCGVSIVPLNARLTAAELAPQLARTAPDLLVCQRTTESTAHDALAATGEHGDAVDAPVLSVDEPTTDDVRALHHQEAAAAEDSKPVSLSRETEQVVMFTSGTTGEPKGVRLTVGNLVASATSSAFRLGVTPADRWLCCLPMYHMGGLAPVVRSTLYGTSLVVQPTFDAERTATVIAEQDVTGVSLVPTMLTRLLDAGWTPPDHLRTVLLGGAPATQSLLERCEQQSVPVFPTYGMTETASQIATATPEQAFAHEGTVGQPLVCTDVSVVDEDGTVCGAGERGELVVDGPTVTPGYLDDERTAAAFGARGLHTGDVGYRDADGRVWVLNRRDDRIVTGGENVDPGEVVAVLRDHPAVERAAVVGVPDVEWGERVAALVVPATGRDPTATALEAHCRGRLAGFKVPRQFAFSESLPRTVSGTVDRDAVRERLSGAGGRS